MENCKIDLNKRIITFNRLSNEKIVNAFTLKPFDFSNNGKNIIIDSNNEIKTNNNNYNNNNCVKYQYNNCIKSQDNDLKNILGINLTTSKIIKPVQKHTNNVQIVDETNINNYFDNTDGLITNLKNVALATSLADCQGILIYDQNKRVIGNVHSGWRGTLKRIVINAIHLMEEKFNSNPADIEIYICPSILKCCFEVDKDVEILFRNEFNDINIDEFIETKDKTIDKNENETITIDKNRNKMENINELTKDDIRNINEFLESKTKKYYIDTVGINKAVLVKEGIKQENIITSNICTKCNSDKIHSYRADGKNAGRNLSIIMMT